MQYFNGISLNSFKSLVKYYKDEATLQFNTYRTRDMLSISDTKSAKDFAELTGISIPLNDLSPTDVPMMTRLFTESLSRNPRIIQFVSEHFILPNIKMHMKMLNMNAVQEIALYRSVQGISGTVWNWRSFHEKLILDTAESLGTDGQTIDLLLNKEIRVINQENETLTNTLKKYFLSRKEPNKIHAIIDIGALFKDYTTVAVLDAINMQLKQEKDNPCKFILYYDDKNKLCARSIQDNTTIELGTSDYAVIKQILGCDESQWFTYYDQAHTTGADIKQDIDARALVTFNKHNTCRDVLQGVIRMRQFAQGQNIDFLLPQNLYRDFGDNPSVAQILSLSITNQETLDKKHNYISAIGKIHRIFQDNIDGVLNNIQDPNLKLKFYAISNSFFIKSNELDPFLKLGEIERDDLIPADVLKNYQKYFLSAWKRTMQAAREIMPFDLESAKSTLDKASLDIIESIKDHLPKTVSQKETLNANATQEASIQATLSSDMKQIQEQQAQAQAESATIPPSQRKYINTAARTRWTLEEFNAWHSGKEIIMEGNVTEVRIEAAVQKCSAIEDADAKVEKEVLRPSRPNQLSQVIDKGDSLGLSQGLVVSPDYQITYSGTRQIGGLAKKPVQYVMKKQVGLDVHAMLITAPEAFELQKMINTLPPNTELQLPPIWIQTVQGTVFAGKKPERLSNEHQIIDEQLRYYSGDIESLTENIDQNHWFTLEKIRPLLTYYEQHILPTELSSNASFTMIQKKLLKIAPPEHEPPNYLSRQFEKATPGKQPESRLHHRIKKPKNSSK